MSEGFVLPLRVRYAEADQQGVVFNAHYLTYFDEAMTAFLTWTGLGYADLIASGYDVMLVRSEIDWRGALRWPDEFGVAVRPTRIGRSSFTLGFTVLRGEEPLVEGRTVYACVDVEAHRSTPLPDHLRRALGPVAGAEGEGAGTSG
jgi:acyl-CoA thioester hydrolase